MLRLSLLAALAVVLSGLSGSASAQVSTFDFEDLTDQGFGTGFGNDASRTLPIDFIGGSNRMRVLRTPSAFQETGRETGNPAEPFYQAMLAASSDEAVYHIKYDYYINTAAFGAGAGNFLQIGTFVNTGNGYYADDFMAPRDVELNQAQLASGNVFSGTVDESFAAKGFDMPLGQTFFRLGFIVNGDGSAQTIHFDNITISPVPEPSSLALVALGVPAFLARRWRKARNTA